MCLLEEKAVSIPLTLPTRNTTVDAVKRNLDQLAGLSALQFDSESDSGFKGRPSFRDLTSFLFQPRDSLRPGPGWLRFFKIGNRGLQPTPDAPKRVPAHRICALPRTLFRPARCYLDNVRESVESVRNRTTTGGSGFLPSAYQNHDRRECFFPRAASARSQNTCRPALPAFSCGCRPLRPCPFACRCRPWLRRSSCWCARPL
jgi:hypothetical protein